MLGYNSIVGSLGGSILHVFEGAPGRRLCEIAYPADIAEDRRPLYRAVRGCRSPGWRRRRSNKEIESAFTLNSESKSNGECHFGRGRHSCLGEDLSSWLWRALTAEFAQLPLRFRVDSAVRRKPDWVFAYYPNIVVDFHA